MRNSTLVIALLTALSLIVLLVTGCTAGGLSENSGAPPAGSRLAYATAEGLYVRDLAGVRPGEEPEGGPLRIYEGAGLVRPVFSQDGSRLMFRQMLEQDAEEKEEDVYRSALYAYDFETGQTVKVLDDPVSYSAGPGGSFTVSTEDGDLMRVDFGPEEQSESGGQSSSALVPKLEKLQVWPEAVDKVPQVSIQYDNLKPSPDFHYLAYNVRVKDDRTDNRPEGFGPYYSGGMYLLNSETGEAVMVVRPVRATETVMGNDPEPGPWAPDGKSLWVWDKPQSGSLSADGVSGFFYFADTGERIDFGAAGDTDEEYSLMSVLPYDENISFHSKGGEALVLAGAGREMFSNKRIYDANYSFGEGIDTGGSALSGQLKYIEDAGLIPAMPLFSSKGDKIYFAAIDENDVREYENGDRTAEDYRDIWPLKRQLYSLQYEQTDRADAGTITQLTSDPAYRNENPVLLSDDRHIIFGRASAEAYDGKMSLWIKDLESGGETRLAEWIEPENTDQWGAERYNDFYGRGSWSGIFTIYDAER